MTMMTTTTDLDSIPIARARARRSLNRIVGLSSKTNRAAVRCFERSRRSAGRRDTAVENPPS
jgi:hypothetical protein